MNTRARRFGRRRSDKRVWVFAILAALGLYATYLASCGKDGGPTTPAIGSSQDTTAGAGSSSTAPTPAATEESPASGLDIKIRNNGEVINNEQETYTACLYHKPFGAGVLVDNWKAKPGKTQSDWIGPDGKHVNPGCEPGEGQIDVIEAATCPPTPHGLSPLAANPNVKIPAEQEECECEPGEWEPVGEPKIETSPWGECPQAFEGEIEDIASDIVRPQCFECQLVTITQTYTNGCQKRDRVVRKLRRRPVECPCETEWVEIDKRRECGDWNECHPHPTASTGNGGQCVQEKECIITIVEQEKCTGKTRETQIPDEENRPCDCPNGGCEQEPPTHSGPLDLPNANPRTECAAFGGVPACGVDTDLVTSTECEPDWWMTKCGQWYEVGPEHWDPNTCSNGQEVSHRTPCDCNGH
jgi:hypothetical protein